MKKKLLLPIFFVLSFNSVFSQGIQQRTWSDGDTLFSNLFSSTGVVIDSTVRLVPQRNVQPVDSFRFTLYGEDKIWPIQDFYIKSAHDIDLITENDDLFYLITDGLERKVFEINYSDPDNPIGPVFTFTGQSAPLVNPVDASIFYRNQRRKILIVDNGGHSVIQVDRYSWNEEWTYGDGSSNRGFNQLSSPTDAVMLPDTSLLLISDTGNNRVIEVNQEDTSVVWTYNDEDQLNPTDIELDTSNNAVLITDTGNHRVLLVSLTPEKTILWQFGTGIAQKSDSTLNSPTDADLLPNGNILICDAGNRRLIEVNAQETIVWKFAHRPLIKLRDADRLPDDRTIIISDYYPPGGTNVLLKNVPTWLGYSDSAFVSQPTILDRKVNLDSIRWTARVPSGTELKIQLRSADNLTDLNEAKWYGPAGENSYYTQSPINVDADRHKAHSHFQFKAFLETSTPLNTPSLTDFNFIYHYFDKNQTGTITSNVITDSVNMIITGWEFLDFKTIQNEPRNIKISIINAETGLSLRKEFFAEDIDTVENHESLSIWDELKNLQSIRLKATLMTNNSATTPVLENWRVSWNSTMSTLSQIHFINADDDPVSHYRATSTYPPVEQKVDQVFVRLNDLNLASTSESVTLQINALRSEDILSVVLERQPEGEFALKHGIPLVIFNLSIPNNTFLEVFDRDTLVTSYTDPTNPADQSSDTVLVVQNSTGVLEIVNSSGNPIDTVSINGSIYARITGEHDHDITSAQDTVVIDIINNETDDIEALTLVEQADSSGQFSTGTFISAVGLPLFQSATGIPGDSTIQTMPGNEIAARYIDNVTLQDVINVQRSFIPAITGGVPSGFIDFDVAPNPYYIGRSNNFRLRAASAIDNLNVERIEIFNIAGLKIRTIQGNELIFDLSQPIPRNVFAYCDNWWNLKNDAGDQVASGTYWIKMYGLISGDAKELTEIRKMIIIR